MAAAAHHGGDDLVVIDDDDDQPKLARSSTPSSVAWVERLVKDMDKRLLADEQKDERKRARSTKQSSRSSGGDHRESSSWSKGTGFGAFDAALTVDGVSE